MCLSHAPSTSLHVHFWFVYNIWGPIHGLVSLLLSDQNQKQELSGFKITSFPTELAEVHINKGQPKEDTKEQPTPRNLSATATRVLQCTKCPVAASRKDFSAIPNLPHLRLGQWWVLERQKFQIIFNVGKSRGPLVF